MTDWLKSWSGKLSALAGIIVGYLTVDPSVLLSALAFMPAGPVRVVLILAVVAATIWLPKKAAEKDNAKTD